jgi:hypothetical protein
MGDDWTLPALKEHFEALLRERDKALWVQTKELHRRLNTLNHAHENAVQIQRTYVTDEKFEAFVARFEENKEVTAEALTLARGNALGRGSRSTDWTRSATLVLMGASVLVAAIGGTVALLH